jgi:hypothetical protein
MFELLVLLGVGAGIAAVVLWVSRPRAPREAPRHDDSLRAGQTPEASPYEAARRAEGKAAWTRISGA